MRKNRYLGVSANLPTENEDDPTSDLVRFAFPGGYEVFYVMEDGEDMCQQCAQKMLTERAEAIGPLMENEYAADYVCSFRLYGSDDTIAGYVVMDQTDSCGHCVECGRFVAASGCGYETDEKGRETELPNGPSFDPATHGEYCSYSHVETVA